MFRTKIKKREAEIIRIMNSLSDCTPEQKEQKIQSIQVLYALELFDNKEYSQSIREFSKLKKDPAEVIRLFPELDNDDKEKTKKLTGKDLQTALNALIEYLKEFKANIENSTGQEEATATQTQQLELIDTTLLKCYLLINAEVSPLLRNSNNCRVEEAETVLLQHRKHRELMILYKHKGLHMKALQLISLLREQAPKQDISVNIYKETLIYLKNLGAEHIDLIFKFSDEILKEHPEKGLKIFTENVEAEILPRQEIFDFLKMEYESLVIPYLEHVVHTWNDTTPSFHNSLIKRYREKITDDKVNLTDAEIQHIRSKLLAILEKSAHYTPERVAVHFPTDSLFEERAIIYGKLGRHEQALAIYVLILGEVDRALKYCEDVGTRPNFKGTDVYVILMKILINPEKGSVFVGKSLANVPRHPETAEPNLEMALNILDTYANHISPLKALSVLPDSVPLDRLKYFLGCAMDGQLTLKRRMQVIKGLWYAEQVQIQELERFHESKSIVINDDDVCPVCKKRFGNQSAFVRYPNGKIVHFSCRLDK